MEPRYFTPDTSDSTLISAVFYGLAQGDGEFSFVTATEEAAEALKQRIMNNRFIQGSGITGEIAIEPHYGSIDGIQLLEGYKVTITLDEEA